MVSLCTTRSTSTRRISSSSIPIQRLSTTAESTCWSRLSTSGIPSSFIPSIWLPTGSPTRYCLPSTIRWWLSTSKLPNISTWFLVSTTTSSRLSTSTTTRIPSPSTRRLSTSSRRPTTSRLWTARFSRLSSTTSTQE